MSKELVAPVEAPETMDAFSSTEEARPSFPRTRGVKTLAVISTTRLLCSTATRRVVIGLGSQISPSAY